MRLEVQNVNCGYKSHEPLLTYLNFNVASGEICCVLGPNGVGKSTLFKTILGLLPALSGKITIDGEDVSKWPASKLGDTIAYVSQSHTPPFPYQVKDIVMLGRMSKIGPRSTPKDMDYYIVDQAIEECGIGHLRNKPYTDISGGELQLVMIAQALAQQPNILVFDEPTAALDYGNAVRVIAHIRELAKRGYMVLMTTHSPDHAFMCNSKVLLLQRDFPMKFGTALDIITEKNMKQAYGMNIKVVEFVNEKNEIVRQCAPVF